MEMEPKIVLNPDITDSNLQKVFEGVIYLKEKLDAFQIYLPLYKNFKDNSKENIVLRNAIIESALLSIRISYEFLFKYELNESDIKKLNEHLKNKQFKDDVIAEYYFEDPVTWIKIKQEMGITFEDLNKIIDKEYLNKKLFHFTFSDKQGWDIIPVISSLIYDLNVFLYYQDKIHDRKYLTEEEIKIIEGNRNSKEINRSSTSKN